VYSPLGYMAGLQRIEQASNALSSLPLYQRVPGGRRTVVVGLFGLAATLAGCGGQEQHITYLTPTVNSNTEIGGTLLLKQLPLKTLMELHCTI
jgi:hypothetical protein